MNDRSPEIAFTATLTSFSLILFAFFIFLDSLTERNATKAEKVLHSLEQHFPKTVQSSDHSTDATTSRFAQEVNPDTDLPALAASLQTRGLFVERSVTGFGVQLPMDILFTAGDEQIKASALAVLRQLASGIRDQGLFVFIESYGEEVPPTNKRFSSSWELASARAASILRLFLDSGIDLRHVRALGYNDVTSLKARKMGDPKFSRVVLTVTSSIGSDAGNNRVWN
jgi:flagellar motor protein MotB